MTTFKTSANFIWGLFDNKFIQGLIAVFNPFIGIPVIVIKNWEGIKSFFMGLPEFFSNLWTGIVDFAVKKWTDFTGWIGGIADKITAPFKAVGDFVDGFLGKKGSAAGSKMQQTMATGINQSTPILIGAINKSFIAADQYLPHSDAAMGPLARLTDSGRSIITTMAGGIQKDDSLTAALNDSFNINNLLDFETPDKNRKPANHLFPEKQESSNGIINNYFNFRFDKLCDDIDELTDANEFIKRLAAICGVNIRIKA